MRSPWTLVLVLCALLGCSDGTGTEGERAPSPQEADTVQRDDGFPDASTTGIPDGVDLQPYTGPMTVETAGTVIDARTLEGTLIVAAHDVVVSRSLVMGNVVVTDEGSLTLTDSIVDAGTANSAAVGQVNLTLRRVEVRGARQSVSCITNCDVQDSWLHGQYLEPGGDWHGNGFVSNGGSAMVLRHNTLECDAEPTTHGACSAAVSLYGDFAPLVDVRVEGNMFTAGPAGYCLYGGYDPTKPFGDESSGIVVVDNVFERGDHGTCGVYGPATAVVHGVAGNVFSGNHFDDASLVPTP